MNQLLRVVPILFAIAARLSAQGEEVTLRVEDPITKAGVEGVVRFTLTNVSPTTITVTGSDSWVVGKDGMPVFTSSPSTSKVKLKPNESKSWSWNKKGLNGKFAPAGNYTVVAGPLSLGGAPVVLRCLFALTASGRLVGTNPFPLAVGNRWEFVNANGVRNAVRVERLGSTKGWYEVQDMPFGTQQMRMTGTARRTLWVLMDAPQSGPKAQALFHFDRKIGETWNFVLLGTLKVMATDETVPTPAGTFEHCYRIEVQPPSDVFGTFWFAKGVGMVRCDLSWLGGSSQSHLERATLKVTARRQVSLGQRPQ